MTIFYLDKINSGLAREASLRAELEASRQEVERLKSIIVEIAKPRGVALWRMWIKEAAYLLVNGRIPYPAIITQNVAGDIKSGSDHIREDVAGAAGDCCHKTRLIGALCPLGWKCPYIKESAEEKLRNR